MEYIPNKHWNILKEDPYLSTTLDDRARVTYRRAPTLKRKIAPSKLQSFEKDNPLCLIPIKGIYRCNKPLSKTCAFVRHGQKSFKHKKKS